MNVADVAVLQGIGQSLARVGYDEGSIAVALGLGRLAALRQADFPLYERRLADQEPLAALVRLFLLGIPIDCRDVETVFPPGSISALCDYGLLGIDGDVLRPLARLTPFDGFIFAHDTDHNGISERDHVLGISSASRTLHALTMRLLVDRALDIGAGCGVQALCVARHAHHVIATDVNPRAVRYANINVALNGVENVDVREGNLLGPVAGETFDLVVVNPPFVLSPDAAFTFRDAGQSGNVSRRLASEIPGFLQPGGFAQMLVSWEVMEDGEWGDEPRRWCVENGCDGWLLSAIVEDGLAYAATWNAWLRQADPVRFASTLDRWTSYYAEHGISGLGTGALTLRRRMTGEPWWKADHSPTQPGRHAGDQVRRVFAAQDRLQALSTDEMLLTTIPRFVDDHRVDQTLRYHDGTYVVDDIRVQLEHGVGVTCLLEPQALLVLMAVDGHRTLGDLIEDVCEDLTADEAETLVEVSAATVRQLVALGLMVLDDGDKLIPS